MIEKYNIFERAFLEINLQTSDVGIGIYYVFKISIQGEQRYLFSSRPVRNSPVRKCEELLVM